MADEGRYRLAPVRDSRTRAERGKRGELAAAIGDARASAAHLDAARARSAAARTAVTAAVGARDALVAAGSTLARLALAERFIARCRRDLDQALGEELRAESTHGTQLGTVDVARQVLARAHADREVIDRHFTRWREARKKLAERRED